jgi:hypothetical protein
MLQNAPQWVVKPLMRNNELYQIEVRIGNRIRFLFRDSLKLLPASLKSLAESLCPELGSKGDIDHASLGIEEIRKRKR